MTRRRVPLGAAAALAALATAGLQAQQPRFRSSAERVMVDVQVKRGGRPVSGLTAADFELRDSGVRQRIDAVTFADVPLSVLLALDVSSSVEGERLAHLKDAADAAIAALRSDDQAALLTFSQRVELRAPWTLDRATIAAAIAGLEGRGATSMHDAIFTGVALRERAAGRTLLIVFTDGRDTASWLGARDVLDAAARSDLVIYGVSTGRSLGDLDKKKMILGGRSADARFDEDPQLYPYAFLDKVTDRTGGEMIRLESTRDLPAAFTRIVTEFKSRYLLSYSPSGVSKRGWHALDVTLANGPSAAVTARRGYMR